MVSVLGANPVGQPKEALETPALVVDLDAMDRNVARMATTFQRAGVGWRPHTKGLKVPALAHRLLAAGALGVTCAKVSEAEVMAAAGIRDLLIANQVIGDTKVRRLAHLAAFADPAAKRVAIAEAVGRLTHSAQCCRAAELPVLLDPCTFVRLEIVHDHDLPRAETPSQNLFDIQLKGGGSG